MPVRESNSANDDLSLRNSITPNTSTARPRHESAGTGPGGGTGPTCPASLVRLLGRWQSESPAWFADAPVTADVARPIPAPRRPTRHASRNPSLPNRERVRVVLRVRLRRAADIACARVTGHSRIIATSPADGLRHEAWIARDGPALTPRLRFGCDPRPPGHLAQSLASPRRLS